MIDLQLGASEEEQGNEEESGKRKEDKMKIEFTKKRNMSQIYKMTNLSP